MLARLFVFIGGLVVLVLTAALVVPYFIDWTSYRADFEREASAILGRDVTVRGDVSARLLPFPSVSFSDISVVGGPEGEPAMTVESFSMDAELAPFMQGEFLIFDMRLVRPKVTVAIGDDGKIDWAMRLSSPFKAAQTALEKLTVTEGQITLRHAFGGRDHVISQIDAEISARSLTGPWRAEGALQFNGMQSVFTISTGRVDERGALRLRLKAEPVLFPLAMEAEGDVRFKDGAGHFAGDFRFGAKSAASVPEAAQQPTEGMAPAVKRSPPYRLSGRFAVDHRRLDFESFRFETGPFDNPYTADGSGFIEFGPQPRFEIRASGAQLSFDDNVADAEKVSGLTLEGRLGALEKVLVNLPGPAIPGTVELSLPAVVAGDTTIRDVGILARPVAQGWDISSLSATLPGRATIEANGLLATKEELAFQGALLLAVGQPSGFAAWLSHEVDDVIRRLPAAGFSAQVDLTREHQFFRNLELQLGGAKLTGTVESMRPENATPSMVIRLEGGALDIDDLAAFSSFFVNDRGMTQLARRDIDLSLRAGPLTAAELTAQSADMSLRIRDGRIEIDRFSIGELEGATVSAAGSLSSIGGDFSARIDASVVAVDLAPLIDGMARQFSNHPILAAVADRSAAFPDLFHDTRIDIAANLSAAAGLVINANGEAGGSTFSLSGSGNVPFDVSTPISLSFTAANQNGEALMALYGLPVLLPDAVGSAETKLTINGRLLKGADAVFEFTGPQLALTGKGVFRQVEGRLEAEGKLRLEADDIEPWLMTAGMSMPGMGLGLPVALAADGSFANGVLQLAELGGKLGDERLDGRLEAAMKNGFPHLAGELALETADLWPVATMVLGDLSHEGGGSWSQAAFRKRVATPFSASLDVRAGMVETGPFGSLNNVTASLRLDDEGVHVSNFRGDMFGGSMSGLVELKNNEGVGQFTAQLTLANADLDSLLAGKGITGQGDLSVSLLASGKSAAAMAASLSGSGSVAFEGMSVSGVNPDALPALLAKADAVGRDLDAGEIAEFAPAIVTGATFSGGNGEAAFTLADGVLRLPALVLETPAARLTAEIRADIRDETVAVTGGIAYAPGGEGLAGSEPAVYYALEGPFAALETRLDMEPLTRFLIQRELEIEQARVESIQSLLLERQRLRRESNYYAALHRERERRAEEEARRKADEERMAAEEAARRKELEDRAAEALRKAEEERARTESGTGRSEIERAPLPDVGSRMTE